jgi:hypothetical protein
MDCKYSLLEFINCIYTLRANSGLILFTVLEIYSLRCFLVGLFCMTPIKVTRMGDVPSVHRHVILTLHVISETT